MFEESRKRQREEAGCWLAFLLAALATMLMAFVLQFFFSSKIDSEKTHRVFDVTDGTGRTYRNLKRFDGNIFVDRFGRRYFFHGNYTAIDRMVTGDSLLECSDSEN